MPNVTIYTDGACSGNPGKGGYCAILMANGKEKIISGGEKDTTNNKMELIATIEGLKGLKQRCKVDIYTDSAYVCNAFVLGWIPNWIKNNWKNSNKKEVANKQLWLELIALCGYHDVTWHKVKGHSDNVNNNRCDEIARKEIEKIN